MKKLTLLVLTALLTTTTMAATPEQLDQLLQEIRSDIAAKRLSSPAGNNALDKITEFRAEAPFDYRVVPLAYDWGEAYVALSTQARSKGELSKAQGYLDKVWKVAALTPGLEDEQRALDQALAKAGGDVNTVAVAAQQKADAEELARQRELAAAEEKEKERLRIEAEKQKKLAAAQAAEKARRDAAEKARREEQERQRRAEQERQRQIAAAAAAKQRKAPSSPVLDSPIDLDDIALDAPAPAPVVRAPIRRPVATASAKTPTAQSTRLWAQAKEDSSAIVEYTVPESALQTKDRQIAEKMGDVCQRMVDEDASLVVHSANKSDYRWLAVRLTICARRIDRSFRLRHSYQAVGEGEPVVVALHPPRDSSLLKQVGQ